MKKAELDELIERRAPRVGGKEYVVERGSCDWGPDFDEKKVFTRREDAVGAFGRPVMDWSPHEDGEVAGYAHGIEFVKLYELEIG